MPSSALETVLPTCQTAKVSEGVALGMVLALGYTPFAQTPGCLLSCQSRLCLLPLFALALVSLGSRKTGGRLVLTQPLCPGSEFRGPE